MAIIRLNNISKSYLQGTSNLLVLENINFEIGEGEVVALLGSSGSGKSTLLQIIGLIDTPTNGTLYVEEQRCSHLPEDELTKIRREKIGYIYQFHHLLPEFTALENVMMPLLIAGKPKAQARNESEQALEKLGLAERMGNLPSELSGGEQQRVAIARSMIHKPKLLLADEPTGNLDHKNGAFVMNMLLTEAKERNLTVLMVTHNLELANLADRILALTDGNIQG